MEPQSRSASWLADHWWQVALVAVAVYSANAFSNHLANVERASSMARAAAAVRDSAKLAADHAEYLAKRRGDCYSIYTRERTAFNNTQRPEYDEVSDVCKIRYKMTGPTPAYCARMARDTSFIFRDLRFDCETRTFTNTF